MNTAAEKERLSPTGDAVDMESAAILSVAQMRKVPAAVIRVISDSFDRDLPADIDTMVDSQGNVNMGGVVSYVARHPLSVPALVRLGRDSKNAAETLARFLESYITSLASGALARSAESEVQEAAAS